MTAFLAHLPPAVRVGLDNVKRGQRVRHVDYGPATVTKVNRRTAAVAAARVEDGALQVRFRFEQEEDPA